MYGDGEEVWETPNSLWTPPSRVSDCRYRGGGLLRRLGRVHQLGADLLLRAALDVSRPALEEPLLRLRAPTCLGLPTHGALSQFGFCESSRPALTVNWTELFMIITTRGSLAQRGPFLLLLFFSLGAVSVTREKKEFKSSKGQ